jgi:hypothetical protein
MANTTNQTPAGASRFDADPTICPTCDFEKHPLEAHCEVCRDEADQLERAELDDDGPFGADCHAAGAGY